MLTITYGDGSWIADQFYSMSGQSEWPLILLLYVWHKMVACHMDTLWSLREILIETYKTFTKVCKNMMMLYFDKNIFSKQVNEEKCFQWQHVIWAWQVCRTPDISKVSANFYCNFFLFQFWINYGESHQNYTQGQKHIIYFHFFKIVNVFQLFLTFSDVINYTHSKRILHHSVWFTQLLQS